MIKTATIYRALVLLCLMTPAMLRAQGGEELELSIEPVTGVETPQYWPSVFSLDGQVYVSWGELRSPNPDALPETWYTLARWTPAMNPPVSIIQALRTDTIALAEGASTRRLRGGSSQRPLAFSGIFAAGAAPWRGDIMAPNGDTVYRSRYSLYFPTPTGWNRVAVDEREQKREVYVVQKGYGYDPVHREVLCAWTVGNETTGNVTSVGVNGTVKWTSSNIPLRGVRVNVIPIAEQEFLTIIDSVAIHYKNGAAQDTFLVGPHQPNASYQRLVGEHFLRGYLTADSTHHVLQRYGFDGTLQKTLDMNWVGRESMYSVTQEEISRLLGITSTGPEGVYATLMTEDFETMEETRKVSKGSDTAASPVALFRGDTLYVAWQNTNNGNVDIRGIAYSYKETDTTIGVPSNPDLSMDVGSIFPNPASTNVRIAITLPFSTAVDVQIVDATGAVAYREGGKVMTAGEQMIDVPLSGMPAGSYTVLVRAGELRATGRLVLVR